MSPRAHTVADDRPAPGASAAPPRLRTPFFGRENDIAAISSLLATEPLVTIQGPGGAGKTRLAAEIVTRLAASANPLTPMVPVHPTTSAGVADGRLRPRRSYRDGIWWVDLSATSTVSGAASAVAAVLTHTDDRSIDGPRTLAAQLCDRDLLLVLDNCEQALVAIADVAAALLSACPDVSILATSRSPLQLSGERTWALAPLAFPDSLAISPDAARAFDAVRLFEDRATRARQTFRLNDDNLAEIIDICRTLDGIPLAVELAAARCRTFTPAQIRQGLGDLLTLLAAGPADVPDRHRSIEASLQWSYQLLDATEQRALRRLSVFSGGWTLDAAAVVLGSKSAMTTLDALVSQSLVVLDDVGPEARFRMQAVVQEFAARDLAATDNRDELATARDLHARYYADLARTEGPKFYSKRAHEAVAVLRPEIENVRAAFAHLIASGFKEQAATALLASIDPMQEARTVRSLLPLFDAVLSDPDELTPATRAAALVAKGGAKFVTGEYIVSMADFAAGLQAARASGEPAWEGAALCGLGYPGIMLDTELAVANFRHAEDRLRGQDVRMYPSAPEAVDRMAVLWFRCHALLGEAAVYGLTGAVERYKNVLGKLGPLITELNNPAQSCWYWLHHAWLARFEGRWSDGFAYAERVHEIAPSLGHDEMSMFADIYCAEVSLRTGQHHPAIERLDGLLARATASGKAHLVIPTRSVVLRRLLRNGDLHGAISFGTSLVADEVALGISGYAVVELETLAAVHEANGDLVAAAKTIERAVEMSWVVHGQGSSAILLLRQASIARAAGDMAAAELHAHKALELLDRSGIRRDLATAFELLAGLALDASSPTEAARLFGAAARERDELDVHERLPPERDRVAADLAALERELGSETFLAARAEGYALTHTEAVAYAQRARGDRKRPTFGWDSLTPTERQVVTLVAEGKTNPEIAKKMFVSRETVKSHMKNVFAKLSVTNRSELAAEAARHGT